MNKNIWAALGCVAIPVGFLIQEHVSWMSTLEGKKRMLTHQLIFWGTAAASLLMMHRTFSYKFIKNTTNPWLKKGLFLGVASGLPILGFEGGGAISRKCFPEKKAFSEKNNFHAEGYNPSLKSNKYVPSYLGAPKQTISWGRGSFS
ncbi:MAG: hypothetical protein K2X66_13155 [Cyanobacteria bacterium]|nr:hypothetical protein [Cyanobacteriota bacterium]